MRALTCLQKSKLPAFKLALISIVTAAGCQTTQTAAIDLRVVCKAFPVITYSSRDTVETARQVVVFNAKRDAMCEGVSA